MHQHAKASPHPIAQPPNLSLFASQKFIHQSCHLLKWSKRSYSSFQTSLLSFLGRISWNHISLCCVASADCSFSFKLCHLYGSFIFIQLKPAVFVKMPPKKKKWPNSRQGKLSLGCQGKCADCEMDTNVWKRVTKRKVASCFLSTVCCECLCVHPKDVIPQLLIQSPWWPIDS